MMPSALDALAALPPWDAASYFQATLETNYVMGSSGDQLCGADPNRVGLIFATTAMSGVYVTPTKSSTGIRGMQISTSLPPLVLLFRDVGPFVQQAFFLSNSFGSANVTVYEIRLYRWPRARDKRIG